MKSRERHGNLAGKNRRQNGVVDVRIAPVVADTPVFSRETRVPSGGERAEVASHFSNGEEMRCPSAAVDPIHVSKRRELPSTTLSLCLNPVITVSVARNSREPSRLNEARNSD